VVRFQVEKGYFNLHNLFRTVGSRSRATGVVVIRERYAGSAGSATLSLIRAPAPDGRVARPAVVSKTDAHHVTATMSRERRHH
jgi:hypothetical protein